MNFSYTAQEHAFRQEVKTWIAEHIPGDWGSEVWPIPADEETTRAHSKAWMATIHEGGWAGIDWPREYGGRAASPIEQFIFQEEISHFRTPPRINGIGIGMAGPTIMRWGTDDQKKRYLSKILSGEEIWCQGFSEPNAGSDLAALQTSAISNGDHYIVNGQKIWTSVAHISDYCILLTLTDPHAGKHKGITYLIVDMKSPGVEVRPLKQITGTAEFNEVFFDNVRVPKENALGDENQGWMVAITTLMHERVNIAAQLYGDIKRTLNEVLKLTRSIQRNGRPLCEDPSVRQRLVYFYNAVETQRLNNLRMRANMSASEDPGPIGSIFKLLWATTNQDLLEMPVDILGPYAELLPGSDAFRDDYGIWMKQFLRARANTIEGGTSEVLRNIISERVLGMPK